MVTHMLDVAGEDCEYGRGAHVPNRLVLMVELTDAHSGRNELHLDVCCLVRTITRCNTDRCI